MTVAGRVTDGRSSRRCGAGLAWRVEGRRLHEIFQAQAGAGHQAEAEARCLAAHPRSQMGVSSWVAQGYSPAEGRPSRV